LSTFHEASINTSVKLQCNVVKQQSAFMCQQLRINSPFRAGRSLRKFSVLFAILKKDNLLSNAIDAKGCAMSTKIRLLLAHLIVLLKICLTWQAGFEHDRVLQAVLGCQFTNSL